MGVDVMIRGGQMGVDEQMGVDVMIRTNVCRCND